MLKKSIWIFLTLFFLINLSFSQIPIDEYRIEIENLKSEKQIQEYWSRLYAIDQEILVNTTNLKIADSISISNMIKTTSLIFDIHETKGYNPKGFSGFLPILNLSHNYIGQCQMAIYT